MLIAPTRSQHQSLQEEKENPIEAEPVLLQEQAATADASATDVPAEETTAISSEGAVETNIGTKTKQNFEQAQTRADELSTLYTSLNTQWLQLKDNYLKNKDKLQKENEKYQNTQEKIYTTKTFTFDTAKTCGVHTIEYANESAPTKTFITQLKGNLSEDPFGDCMDTAACVAYDNDKIYGITDQCNNIPTDGTEKISDVNWNMASEKVYIQIGTHSAQVPVLADAAQSYNTKNAELEKVEALQGYQGDMKKAELSTTKALTAVQSGIKVRRSNFEADRNEADAKFRDFSDAMSASMQQQREGVDTFNTKLAAEKVIFEQAEKKSSDFAGAEGKITSDINSLGNKIDSFMKTEKIEISSLAFKVNTGSELQAVQSLQSIRSNWEEFSNLFDTHKRNVVSMANKIKEMEATISKGSADIVKIEKEIWSENGDVTKPAKWINGEIMINNHGQSTDVGVCTLRVSENVIGKCRLKLTTADDKTVYFLEGEHVAADKGLPYKSGSKITIEKFGPGGWNEVDDTQTDCIARFDRGSASFLSGNGNDFKMMNEYMPLDSNTQDADSDILWESATNTIRVYSSSRNTVHAMKLKTEDAQKLQACKAKTTCEAVARNLCLEIGSDCVGVWNSGSDYGLLSQGSGDYHKDTDNPTVNRCWKDGASSTANDSGSIKVKMKSHFQDYMLYKDLIDRDSLLQSAASAMLADVNLRNNIWNDALTETKKKRASQEETTLAAKTLMDETQEKVDTLYRARVSAKNSWLEQNKIEGATFDSISAKRKEFLSNHSTFKDEIKHVYNHPVWKTFKEKAVADQGSALA
jgi:hypothetical protein